MVEQSAVNRSVVGSNPTCGAKMESCPSGRRSTIGNRVGGVKPSRGFKSLALRQMTFTSGPLVKRLRHRPFTAVTRVRIPYGSPLYVGGLAQLGEHLPYKQGVIGSSPVTPTNYKFKYGLVVQLVRMLACHARGRGFESLLDRHLAYFELFYNLKCRCSSIGRATDL